MYNCDLSAPNPQTLFPSGSASISNSPCDSNSPPMLRSSYIQQMPAPTKRQLKSYDEKNENQNPAAKRTKSETGESEIGEEDSASNVDGEQSESESETKSSSSQNSNHTSGKPSTLRNPLAHSTPIFPAQPSHVARANYWGDGSAAAAAQFQMASYLGYPNYSNLTGNNQAQIVLPNGSGAVPFADLTNNYYDGNSLINQRQMMASYASYSHQLANLNQSHVNPTPASHQTPDTNTFLPFTGNSTHHNPALGNATNFSNLASSIELTPDSGLGRVHRDQPPRLDSAQQHQNSSGNSSASTSGTSGAGTDESYNNESVEHKNVLALNAYHQQACNYNRHSQRHIANPLIDPNAPYCEVSGRLALLSNNKRYKVTLSEIYRRISPPECLNASFLGGILRKAKNKNGGNELRNTLKRYGMSLPSGRRKSQPCTTFTSLCEEEAKQMGKDYFTLCKELFPCAALAKLSLISKPVSCLEDTRRRLNSVQWANQIVHELIVTVQEFELSSTPTPQAASVPSTSEAENTAKDGIVKFSRLTHGFGNAAMITAWKAFQEFLKCYSLELNQGSMIKQEGAFKASANLSDEPRMNLT